ncbi:MAG TPA: DUF4296 domain-containing protein [Chitinophagaceae bacterium]|jgi:hypothetical protein|nr:DUF4296 domain-containing protein [Chitinophagaceae bacterium]
MRFSFFIILIILTFGCIQDKKIPKDILPQNEMRKIMWDLMRADAYVSTFIMKDSTKNQKTESVILYEKIFYIHSTTRENFKKSLAFYESRPDLFKAISDSLRTDERKAQEYQNETKPGLDTTYRKMKLNKKLVEKKP